MAKPEVAFRAPGRRSLARHQRTGRQGAVVGARQPGSADDRST